MATPFMNNLALANYNRTLMHWYELGDRVDPICTREIDETNKWLTGRWKRKWDSNFDLEYDFVFDGEDLTWDAVNRASGVDEPVHNLTGRWSTTWASNLRAIVQVQKFTRSSVWSPLEFVDAEDASDFDTDGEEYVDYINASDVEKDDTSVVGLDVDWCIIDGSSWFKNWDENWAFWAFSYSKKSRFIWCFALFVIWIVLILGMVFLFESSNSVIDYLDAFCCCTKLLYWVIVQSTQRLVFNYV